MVKYQDYSHSGPFSHCRGKLGACGNKVVAAVSELCAECKGVAKKVEQAAVAEVKKVEQPKPAPAPPAPKTPEPAKPKPVEPTAPAATPQSESQPGPPAPKAAEVKHVGDGETGGADEGTK